MINNNKLKITARQQIKRNAGGMTMSKIQMTTPLVEMDGDEMTRILWKMIKDELLLPFIDLKTGILRPWVRTQKRDKRSGNI